MESTAIGFQVIAQLGVKERVHRLYVNQTLLGLTSASVEVKESGEYVVSVLPISEEGGITGSVVEFRRAVMLIREGSLTPGTLGIISYLCSQMLPYLE